MRKPYSPAYIAETVALAVIIGADETARRRNIDVRTVRGWCAKAGKAPSDAIASPQWRELGELARSGVAADLAAGKLTAVQKATIAGIAERNARELPRPVEPDKDEYIAALREQFGEHVDLALIASIYRLEDLGYGNDDAVPDDVAREVWEWVAAIPELPAWHIEQQERIRQRYLAQLEANQRAREAEQRAGVDAVLAAAEAYLQENAA